MYRIRKGRQSELKQKKF